MSSRCSTLLGLTVEIAPHSLATVDIYAKNDDLLLPAFTESGKLAGLVFRQNGNARCVIAISAENRCQTDGNLDWLCPAMSDSVLHVC